MTKTITPGYNRRLSIKFVGNRAFYRSSSFRWLPIKVAEAKKLISAGTADECR